jgi:REP element-mobilizing transposase RayT
MPRTARASVGDICYHVINRGNAQIEVFHKDGDYRAFVELIGLACQRISMRVLAYCVMPNHFHLVVWPRSDKDLGRWMQWLLTAHVRRYHQSTRTLRVRSCNNTFSSFRERRAPVFMLFIPFPLIPLPTLDSGGKLLAR